MTARNYSLPVSLLLATVAVLQVGCTQPDVNCTSAHGTFAARFDRKSGPADQPCGQLVGDILGMSTYYAPGGLNNTPMFAKPSIAIRAQHLYAYIYDVVYAPKTVLDTRKIDKEVGDPDSLGDFAAGVPDDEGFCAVPKMSKVNLDLPEVVEVMEVVEVIDDPLTEEDETVAPVAPVAPQAEATLAYEWSKVKFLVTADAQGTQFSADLKFTQDACTATYHVVGVYPAIDCADDPTICDSDVNGINPDFPTECLTFQDGAAYCVLKGELPAYDNAA